MPVGAVRAVRRRRGDRARAQRARGRRRPDRARRGAGAARGRCRRWLVAAGRLHPGRDARAVHDVRRGAGAGPGRPRLVYGAADPKAGAVGSLWDVVRDPRLNHRPEVVGGVLADECGAVLRAFFGPHRGMPAVLARVSPAVACPSGRRSTPRKRVRGQALRGFKSHRHRQQCRDTSPPPDAGGGVVVLRHPVRLAPAPPPARGRTAQVLRRAGARQLPRQQQAERRQRRRDGEAERRGGRRERQPRRPRRPPRPAAARSPSGRRRC